MSGAIDMAWQSPENCRDTTSAQLLAGKLGLEQHFLEALMNSLYEDAQVRTLWRLWQTEVEPPRARAAAAP